MVRADTAGQSCGPLKAVRSCWFLSPARFLGLWTEPSGFCASSQPHLPEWLLKYDNTGARPPIRASSWLDWLRVSGFGFREQNGHPEPVPYTVGQGKS